MQVGDHRGVPHHSKLKMRGNLRPLKETGNEKRVQGREKDEMVVSKFPRHWQRPELVAVIMSARGCWRQAGPHLGKPEDRCTDDTGRF